MIELYLTLASHHFDNSYDYNEVNPGIMLQYEGFVFGGYKNSFSENSFLVAKKIEFQWQDFSYGALTGAVTNYDTRFTFAGLTPLISPFVSYNIKEWNIKPTLSLLDIDVIGLSAGFTF